MKNVLLSLVATCAITSSFAQYNPFGYNNATLQQSGDYQHAYITQSGNYNQAGITQENKDGIGGNYISVFQIGNYVVSGDNHSIVAKQSGSNEAILNQYGASARVELLQVGFGNRFESSQTGTAKTYLLTTVKQTGISNEAYLTQTNTIDYTPGIVATFTQTGENNLARLTQLGFQNETNLIQQGNGNVIQGLGGMSTSALQSGLGNQLNITQKQDYNTVSVGQTGNSNVGIITQMAH